MTYKGMTYIAGHPFRIGKVCNSFGMSATAIATGGLMPSADTALKFKFKRGPTPPLIHVVTLDSLRARDTFVDVSSI